MQNHHAPQNWAEAARRLREQYIASGGWLIIRRMAVLWIYGASLFLLVVCPYELSKVYAVREWLAVPAHVVSVDRVTPPFHNGPFYWQFQIRRDDTGAEMVTTAVRPGTIEFNALGWSTTDFDTARYPAGKGVTIYVSPDGQRFFFEQGNPILMETIIVVCLTFWAWVVYYVWRRKNRAKIVN